MCGHSMSIATHVLLSGQFFLLHYGHNIPRPYSQLCSGIHYHYQISIKFAICSLCLATLWPCAFGHFFCLGHTNLNLCCAGGNGLQVRLVGRFKNKNDSHMISGFYGNSNHVTSLHSRGIGALRIRQEIFLAALRVLTL